MRNLFFIPLMILIISSCRIQTTENYYTVTITEDASIYLKSSLNSDKVELVRSGQPIYMILDKAKNGFRKVKYNGKTGYVYRPAFKAYSKSDYQYGFVSNVTRDSITERPVNSYTPSKSTGGTVHVKGYYRKNGTYVRPHTRSAPRRR